MSLGVSKHFCFTNIGINEFLWPSKHFFSTDADNFVIISRSKSGRSKTKQKGEK